MENNSVSRLTIGFGLSLALASVLNALLDRIERIEPTGKPTYRPLNTMRTLETLPIRLVPA